MSDTPNYMYFPPCLHSHLDRSVSHATHSGPIYTATPLWIRSKAQAAETLRRTLRHADADRQAIFKKGPRQVGLKSMDIVTDLQQHGAFKGFKRQHQ